MPGADDDAVRRRRRDTLDAIEARGLRWGIVTNKFERFTIPVVAALGLARRAAVVVGGDTTPHAKPHPAPLLHAAHAMRVAPSACVYVGDDLRDIEAGNAAGMATIVAGYGYMGVGGDPRRWPATGWIDSPRDLVAWLPARGLTAQASRRSPRDALVVRPAGRCRLTSASTARRFASDGQVPCPSQAMRM